MTVKTPHLHIKGKGEPVHFYHANGFPAEVYTPFLTQLSEHFDVYAMNGRATWENSGEPSHKNWEIFADDLIKHLEETQNQPIIAIGHSMGASATVLAAIKRPDLFKALVLIEPAMVDWPMRLMFKFVPKNILAKNKLISGTAKKADTWINRETYKKYLKRFKGYRLFNENAFDAFMHHGVKEIKEGKVQLRFPNQWEAYNYTNPPYLMKQFAKLKKGELNIPTIAIRGKKNGFFSDKLWQTWQRHQPSAVYLQDKNYGHLMPLEGPLDTVTLILKGLSDIEKII